MTVEDRWREIGRKDFSDGHPRAVRGVKTINTMRWWLQGFDDAARDAARDAKPNSDRTRWRECGARAAAAGQRRWSGAFNAQKNIWFFEGYDEMMALGATNAAPIRNPDNACGAPPCGRRDICVSEGQCGYTGSPFRYPGSDDADAVERECRLLILDAEREMVRGPEWRERNCMPNDPGVPVFSPGPCWVGR